MADVMRRILKRKLQASYTAEAAVLIPVGFTQRSTDRFIYSDLL